MSLRIVTTAIASAALLAATQLPFSAHSSDSREAITRFEPAGERFEMPAIFADASESMKRRASASPTQPVKHPSQAFEEASATQARVQGTAWLKAHQNEDGGWASGSWGRSNGVAQSDVATTSLAVMALLRDAGDSNDHRDAILRGVRFVIRRVEESPSEGPGILGPQGTQPQYKLGRNVDTHFASLMFGELAGHTPPELDARLQAAYDKVLTKVVAAQRADGSFDSDGWAPVLSSSVAAQSLSRAYELGKPVAPEALEKSDAYQRKLVDQETGEFDASAGAGVDLYAAASSLRGNSDAAKRAASPSARVRAEDIAEVSRNALARDRGQLTAGFGSIGGEEMLSYMMISDSLVEAGGDPWSQWEQRIGANLVAIQNADGSWSGHHCITSTPFVTAAAVMTLASEKAHQQKLAAQSSR